MLATPEATIRQEETIEDRAFLGREFLTWLVWRVETGEGTFEDPDGDFTVAFGGRVRLKALAGGVNDAVLKGLTAAYSIEARAGIGAGRTVREAELRVARGDREWRGTLAADTLDLKGVKLPEALKRGRGDDDAVRDEEALLERLALLGELDAMIGRAFATFLEVRARPAWGRSVVPSMSSWVGEQLRFDRA